MQDWKEKALDDQYLRQTKEVRNEQACVWLQNGDLKRETESLIVAAQNQSIRTSLVKAKIDENQKETPCKADGSTDHVAFGCSKLPEKDYERIYDNLGEIVHWKLARKCSFNAGDDCYEDEPESFSENKDYKILWGFSIQTGHVLKAQR